jgi:hypothetical protein
VDLALGLVLFDLGRRMDLQWMKREWTLAATGLAESLLAFGAVFATLLWFDVRAVKAGIAAAIAWPPRPPSCSSSCRTRAPKGRSRSAR